MPRFSPLRRELAWPRNCLLVLRTKEEIFEAIVRDRIQPVFAIAATMSAHWQGTQADLLRQIIAHFYGQMIESEERRMILKTLISEGVSIQ